MFKIPIVLFTFKRKDTVLRILDRISEVKPQKLYIISDGPRNDEEKNIIIDTRKAIEKAISWECEIIKNYSEINRGVYENIGCGAKWVFSIEEKAIFLEDDNLPAVTFFPYCEEMLERYQADTRILWVCGTNYLEKFQPEDKSSYMFTRHLLPCGWASWSHKFTKYYDGELDLLSEPNVIKRLRREYENKSLFNQDKLMIEKTKLLLINDQRNASWDRQMMFSIRINGFYGISPTINQIENIGVDEHSIHGGTSFNKVMTRRFCGIKADSLQFPLVHPAIVLSDKTYEKKIGNIILLPLIMRIRGTIVKCIKIALGINTHVSLKEKVNEVIKTWKKG